MLTLNVHAVAKSSRVNGPGTRFVLWVQGCTRACPGCFNPETHNHVPKTITALDSLVSSIQEQLGHIEGVTLSGGEPFEQPDAILELLKRVRQQMPALSVLIFSGYTRKEIERIPGGPEILNLTDVLIAGPYNRLQHNGTELLGSSNQTIWLLTDRYSMQDIRRVPHTELSISADGTITASGIAPVPLGELK